MDRTSPVFRRFFQPSPRRVARPMAIQGYVWKDQFALPTLFMIGALFQITLSLLLPTKYAVLPAALVFIWASVPTIYALLVPSANPYMKTVILGRATSVLPALNDERTRYLPGPNGPDPTPSKSGVVTLHLGSSYNHPLGVFSPGSQEVIASFRAMAISLATSGVKGKPDYGYLGMSQWRSATRATKNVGMTVFYFRDLEGLRAFADSEVHRDGVRWWAEHGKKYPHIGIFHETYNVPAGSFETIYEGMPPTLLGAVNLPLDGPSDGGDEKSTGYGGFVSPLVDGKMRGLKTMDQRMGNVQTGPKM